MLAGLRGKGVDDVAATLLGLLDTRGLETGEVPPGSGGARVDQVASELLGLVGPELPKKNTH